MRTTLLIAAAGLAGMVGMAVPAQARVFFGFGFYGAPYPYYGYPYYGYPYYRPPVVYAPYPYAPPAYYPPPPYYAPPPYVAPAYVRPVAPPRPARVVHRAAVSVKPVPYTPAPPHQVYSPGY